MAKKLAAKAAPAPAVETRSFTTHPRILADRALDELSQLSNLNDPPVVSAKVRRKK